jgi:hypothetical protein
MLFSASCATSSGVCAVEVSNPSRSMAGVAVKLITMCSTSIPIGLHSAQSASLKIRLNALEAVYGPRVG